MSEWPVVAMSDKTSEWAKSAFGPKAPPRDDDMIRRLLGDIQERLSQIETLIKRNGT